MFHRYLPYMIKDLKHQDLDLWEVWIEYDQSNPNYFGTLYIMGDVLADKNDCPPLIIKSNHADPTHLILLIPSRTNILNSCIKEVVYSEPVANLDQYHSISIYSGNELVVRLHEIEILI